MFSKSICVFFLQVKFVLTVLLRVKELTFCNSARRQDDFNALFPIVFERVANVFLK